MSSLTLVQVYTEAHFQGHVGTDLVVMGEAKPVIFKVSKSSTLKDFKISLAKQMVSDVIFMYCIVKEMPVKNAVNSKTGDESVSVYSKEFSLVDKTRQTEKCLAEMIDLLVNYVFSLLLCG